MNAPQNLSEYAVKPKKIILHNPSKALHHVTEEQTEINNNDELQEKFLFREKVNRKIFEEQYAGFTDVVRNNVDEVLFVEDILGEEGVKKHEANITGNPNQIYTRDSIITFSWDTEGYMITNMKQNIRKPENDLMRDVFEKLKMNEILQLPEDAGEDLILEGGDVIPFQYGDTRALLVGFGRRTSYETIKFMQENFLGEHIDEIIGVELAEWRINLDGGMVPIADDVVVTNPESLLRTVKFDKKGEHRMDILKFLKELGYNIVATNKFESKFQQACNILCLGERSVIAYDMCQRVIDLLRNTHGIDVNTFSGNQLVLGTGGPRCMSKPIYF